HGTPGEGSIGLTVANLATDYVIRDLDLSGFDVGVAVLNSTCQTCTVRLANVTISDAKVGLFIDLGPGTLALDGVHIVTRGGGVVTRTVSGDSHWQQTQTN